jgi:hypothetical protein
LCNVRIYFLGLLILSFSSCKRLVDAEKKITIQEAPLILTVQLKRFTFHGYDCKISRQILFPESLDLDPFISKTSGLSEPKRYSLLSVLVHSGSSCHAGHYYSFVKSSNGIWYSMNDDSVHPVSSSTVLRQPAYVLFYGLDMPISQQSEHINESSIESKIEPGTEDAIETSLLKTSVTIELPSSVRWRPKWVEQNLFCSSQSKGSQKHTTERLVHSEGNHIKIFIQGYKYV